MNRVTMIVLCAALTLFAVGFRTPHARAEPPKPDAEAIEMFKSLYGEDLQRVRATRDENDDFELANRLLEAARNPDTHQRLVVPICDEVAALCGQHAEAIDLAVEAMSIMTDRSPEHAAYARAKLGPIYENWYRLARGDDRRRAGQAYVDHLVDAAQIHVADHELLEATALYRQAIKVASGVDPALRTELLADLDGLRIAQRTHAEIARAKNLLQADPKNTDAARKIVQLYLVELDDPAEARKYSFLADEAEQNLIRLATTPTHRLADADAMALAEWYEKLADQATSLPTKAAMNRRAVAAYERFLTAHEPRDLERSKAVLALQKLERALKDAPAPRTNRRRPTRGEWIELLDLVDPDRHTVLGGWKEHEGGLISGVLSFCRFRIPVEPIGDYEFRTEMNWLRGGIGQFAMMFPVGQHSITVSISYQRDDRGGLLRHNGTWHIFDLPAARENERWYEMMVRVRQRRDSAEVTVFLDGRQLTKVTDRLDTFSTDTYYQIPDRRQLGVCGHLGLVVIRKASIRMLSGHLRHSDRDSADR